MNYDIDLCSGRHCAKKKTCKRYRLFLRFKEHEDGEAFIIPYCVDHGLYIHQQEGARFEWKDFN